MNNQFLEKAALESASLTDVETAKILGVSTSSLRNARCQRKGTFSSLPYHKFGRSIRYSMADILAFQDKCKVNPGS